MTATIREANVFTDTWNLLFGKLNSITDPGGKSKWIYSAFPERKVDKATDYPLVVISPTDASYDPLTFRSLKRGPVRFSIDVYSTKAEQLDSVSSSIIDKMESSEGDFLTSGINVMRLISTPYEQFPREKFRIHNKTIIYEFDFGWF